MRKLIFNQEKRLLVVDMVDRGFQPSVIAREIGITETSLRCLCSKFGISLKRGPGPKRIMSEVSSECFIALLSEADRMNTTVPKMVTTLLEVVAKEKLFDALDLPREEACR